MSMPNITYMDQYINDGNQNILSLKNLYDALYIDDADDPNNTFKVPINDFFIAHRKELQPYIKIMNLPQTHFYKPKLTSVMLYGTTELWLSILRVNGLKNVTEYHLPFIRYYDPDGLKTIINIYFKRQDKTT